MAWTVLPDFDRAVAALAAVFAMRCGHSEHATGASGFLIATEAEMPAHLRLAFRILTLTFDASPFLRSGRSFHALTPSGQAAHVAAWEQSWFAPCRDLMMFYRGFTIFSVFSDAHPRSGRG